MSAVGDSVEQCFAQPRVRNHLRPFRERQIGGQELNERDYLPQARKAAYFTYRARLKEYVEARDTTRAALLARAIGRYDHPSVWAEIENSIKSNA